jgi:hypothetical protein
MRIAALTTGCLLVGLMVGCEQSARVEPAAPPVSAVSAEGPAMVTGDWAGSWKSNRSGHGGDLLCTVEPGPDGGFKAVFNAKCSFTADYKIDMVGRAGEKGIAFEGSADLDAILAKTYGEKYKREPGKGYGVYHWTGLADGKTFAGTYKSDRGDTGAWTMTRPSGDDALCACGKPKAECTTCHPPEDDGIMNP